VGFGPVAPGFTALCQFSVMVLAASYGTATLRFTRNGTAGSQTLLIAAGN
jgi:hypothetical protein